MNPGEEIDSGQTRKDQLSERRTLACQRSPKLRRISSLPGEARAVVDLFCQEKYWRDDSNPQVQRLRRAARECYNLNFRAMRFYPTDMAGIAGQNAIDEAFFNFDEERARKLLKWYHGNSIHCDAIIEERCREAPQAYLARELGNGLYMGDFIFKPHTAKEKIRGGAYTTLSPERTSEIISDSFILKVACGDDGFVQTLQLWDLFPVDEDDVRLVREDVQHYKNVFFKKSKYQRWIDAMDHDYFQRNEVPTSGEAVERLYARFMEGRRE